MKRVLKPIILKTFLDGFAVAASEEYPKLEPFVEFNRFKKGEVVRPAGTAEDFAHYIIEGTIALFQEDRLVRPYFPQQVAFDLDSYANQSLSPFHLVALEACVVFSVSRANEAKILQELPAFREISLKIFERAKKGDKEWIAVSQMHYKDAIPYIQEKMGKHFNIFQAKQLASLVGVNERTIKRYNKKLFTNRKSLAVKARGRELFNYPFKSIVHEDVEEVDYLVTCWASEHKLLPNQKAILKYQKMKMTWLSARLYPEVKIEKAIWLGCLYALLFTMDDLTDKLPNGEKHKFWQKISDGLILTMENGALPTQKSTIRPYWEAFADLWDKLLSLASQEFIQFFKELVFNYVKENCWEALNHDLHQIPTIAQYLHKRPVFSGGHLAISLIPFTMEEDHQDIFHHWQFLKKYNELASKLIFISNDLLSFDKEFKIEDPHNWIFLLMEEEKLVKEEAILKLLEIHAETLQAFNNLDTGYQENYTPSTRAILTAIKNIKYQISGAVAWSITDTKRYMDF
ncbi:terpene synthase [Rhodonellum sp.]|uniref:terpene synthase family protein n=1 Tax=Rhodonellum sp. TaxID=2231180 RepID=UPI0027169D5B|nr:terpene synthase [Rhodonellum sp.]MDO9552234.1 terpene synthase [Rhodonellum sp.]